jgi:hypothetical protein
MAHPGICLSPNLREKIARGEVSSDQQDSLIGELAEFSGKSTSPPSLSFHLRSLVIHSGLKILWSESQRQALFRTIVPKIKGCRPRSA